MTETQDPIGYNCSMPKGKLIYTYKIEFLSFPSRRRRRDTGKGFYVQKFRWWKTSFLYKTPQATLLRYKMTENNNFLFKNFCSLCNISLYDPCYLLSVFLHHIKEKASYALVHCSGSRTWHLSALMF